MSIVQALLVTITMLTLATRAQALLLRGTTALWQKLDDDLRSPIYCNLEQTLTVMRAASDPPSCIPARLDHAARRLPRQRLPAAFCLLEKLTQAGIPALLARLGYTGGEQCD